MTVGTRLESQIIEISCLESVFPRLGSTGICLGLYYLIDCFLSIFFVCFFVVVMALLLTIIFCNPTIIEKVTIVELRLNRAKSGLNIKAVHD